MGLQWRKYSGLRAHGCIVPNQVILRFLPIGPVDTIDFLLSKFGFEADKVLLLLLLPPPPELAPLPLILGSKRNNEISWMEPKALDLNYGRGRDDHSIQETVSCHFMMELSEREREKILLDPSWSLIIAGVYKTLNWYYTHKSDSCRRFANTISSKNRRKKNQAATAVVLMTSPLFVLISSRANLSLSLSFFSFQENRHSVVV